MQHRLFGLRGKAYVKEMKRIMAEDGIKIANAFHQRVENNGGKFSARDLGAIANEFKLPLTVLDDYLPSLTFATGNFRYPVGTWKKLQSAGVKAKDIGVVWNEGDY